MDILAFIIGNLIGYFVMQFCIEKFGLKKAGIGFLVVAAIGLAFIL